MIGGAIEVAAAGVPPVGGAAPKPAAAETVGADSVGGAKTNRE